MSCPGLEALERYVDGALDEPARREVDSHVSSCASCRERVAEVQRHLDLAGRVVAADACPSGAATVIAGSAAAPGAHVGVGSDSGATSDADATSDASATSDADATTLGEPRPPAGPRELPKDSLPGYSILKEISRGGQGVVYQAIQRSTSRKVAIKVLRDGHFADAGDRARFEREVQILGQLKHANIVSIYDSGSVGGHAFFVMDYVSGKALDEWATDLRSQVSDSKAQTPGGRPLPSGGRAHPSGRDAAAKAWLRRLLEVFAGVCDAVHAAHLRGIIHRDLKPSNIRIDADNQPRVLDFGVAKVAGAAEGVFGTGVSPVMTLTGQFLGSLPWSSPEQAEGQPSKIDIRTDVYSLGVILYQLLTGRFPYDITGNPRDVLDRIMRAEPSRPSATVWHGRPARDWLNDELDTIVLKCLAKERERRYQSAGELGRDIRHYLAGEAIEAKQDSAWYLVRKSLARHRTPVAVAGAFLVLVVASAAVAVALYLRADEQRAHADAQRRRAEESAQQLKQVVAFQSSMLNSLDPHRMGAAIVDSIRDQLHATMTARGRPEHIIEERLRDFRDAVGPVNRTDLAQTVLDNQFLAPLEARIEREFGGRPDLEAALRHMLAETYLRLGFNARALESVSRAVELRRVVLGDEDPDTLASVLLLAKITAASRFIARAEQQAREALTGFRKSVGDDDSRTLDAMATLGELLVVLSSVDEADALSRELLERQVRLRGADDSDTVRARCLRGDVLMIQDHPDEAAAVFRAALESRSRTLGPSDPETLAVLHQLGILYRWMDRFTEAELCIGNVIEAYRQVFGETHPQTVGARRELAFLLAVAGRVDEAEEIYRANERIMMRRDGESGGAKLGQGTVARLRGRFAEAEKHYRAGIAATQAEVPAGHRWLAIHTAGLGASVAHQGRFAEAEPLLLDAADVFSKQPVPRHFRRECTRELVYLYESWDAAEPGKGYEQMAAEWRAKLQALTATSQPVRQSNATAKP